MESNKIDLPEFDEVFELINKNLKFSGIPLDDFKLGLKFYIPYIAIVIMIFEELCFFVSRISSENFLELTALAPCLGIGVLSAAKMLVIALKRREVSKLTECLRELYEDITHNANKEQLVKHEIVLLKSLTKYYFVLNILLILVYNFSTVLLMLYALLTKGEVTLSLPYAILVPFRTDVWYNWLIVYTHSCFSGLICVLYYVTVDILYCTLSSQVCCNFAIISNEIENLTPANVDSLSLIIKKHQYLLTLTDMLEDIFKAPNLFNVLAGSIEICALGFNILTGDWDQMPGFVLFLLSEILQILFMSVFGEKIIRESSRVGEAAYLCEWYEMEPKYKKMILILMTRSHKPQELTAYKFSAISYGSFSKIISTSWSYFTILKTIYKPSDTAQLHMETN